MRSRKISDTKDPCHVRFDSAAQTVLGLSKGLEENVAHLYGPNPMVVSACDQLFAMETFVPFRNALFIFSGLSFSPTFINVWVQGRGGKHLEENQNLVQTFATEMSKKVMESATNHMTANKEFYKACGTFMQSEYVSADLEEQPKMLAKVPMEQWEKYANTFMSWAKW